MWSSAFIPGKPVVSVIAIEGTETPTGLATAARLSQKLKRRKVTLGSSKLASMLHTNSPATSAAGSNCFLLVWTAFEGRPNDCLSIIWDNLLQRSKSGPILVALLAGLDTDPNFERIIETLDPEIPFLLTQTRSVPFHHGEAYILKFFSELALHSPDNISGRMVWFSAAKAAALLKTRGVTSPFTLRL